MPPEDRRLTRLTRICLELPEATREDSGRHATFSVRKKTFAYYLDDHRGDEGIVGVVCKVRPGESAALIAEGPERFYAPAYLAHRGWVGLRLDTTRVDWQEVAGVAVTSYLLTAPKRLAAQVQGHIE